MKIVKLKDVVIGNKYQISGDLQNGFFNGKPYIGYDDVYRKIIRITDTHVICECRREFLINDNLKIQEF